MSPASPSQPPRPPQADDAASSGASLGEYLDYEAFMDTVGAPVAAAPAVPAAPTPRTELSPYRRERDGWVTVADLLARADAQLEEGRDVYFRVAAVSTTAGRTAFALVPVIVPRAHAAPSALDAAVAEWTRLGGAIARGDVREHGVPWLVSRALAKQDAAPGLPADDAAERAAADEAHRAAELRGAA